MELKPFPGTSGPEQFKILVDAQWSGSKLDLSYHLSGPFSLLSGMHSHNGVIKGGRKDDLWKTTCFEVFFQPQGSTSYWELNLSPAGDWAFYRFTGYREGRSNPSLSSSPKISCEKKEKAWHLTASLDLGDQDEIVGHPMMFSPCAVVQEQPTSEITYWAVEHHREKPDFHENSRYVRMLLPQENS